MIRARGKQQASSAADAVSLLKLLLINGLLAELLLLLPLPLQLLKVMRAFIERVFRSS